MDTNRITGPGYYPRRPTQEKPRYVFDRWGMPSEPPKPPPWPDPREGHSWWQFRRLSARSTPEEIEYDFEHFLGDWVWFEARDARHAEQRAEAVGIRWGMAWGRGPAHEIGVPGHSGYRHFMDGHIERVR